MARVFTLNIDFREQVYTALVCLKSKGYDLSFFVHYLNREIYQRLPEGNLEFSLSEGLKLPAAYANEWTNALTIRTAEAISEYLDHEKNL